MEPKDFIGFFSALGYPVRACSCIIIAQDNGGQIDSKMQPFAAFATFGKKK